MNECLGGDHAIEQLTARVARARNDGSVNFSRRVIEGKRRYGRQYCIEARAPNGGLIQLAINTAFEFNTRNDGHQNGIVEFSNPVRDLRIAVAQMDGDIGIDQECHRLKIPPLRQFLGVPLFDAARSR